MSGKPCAPPSRTIPFDVLGTPLVPSVNPELQNSMPESLIVCVLTAPTMAKNPGYRTAVSAPSVISMPVVVSSITTSPLAVVIWICVMRDFVPSTVNDCDEFVPGVEVPAAEDQQFSFVHVPPDRREEMYNSK